MSAYELVSTVEIDFNIIRLLDKDIVASHCKLDLLIHIEPVSSGDHNTILRCMRWWINNILDQSVCYSVINEEANLDTFAWCSNHVIMAPDEPNDWLLLVLICAKLNAIGEGIVKITSAKMTSNTSEGFGNIFAGDPVPLLPNNNEWVGTPAFRDQPWWNRSDGGTIDIKITGDEEELPANIEIDIRSRFNTPGVASTPVAEIIRPNFQIVTNTDD